MYTEIKWQTKTCLAGKQLTPLTWTIYLPYTPPFRLKRSKNEDVFCLEEKRITNRSKCMTIDCLSKKVSIFCPVIKLQQYVLYMYCSLELFCYLWWREYFFRRKSFFRQIAICHNYKNDDDRRNEFFWKNTSSSLCFSKRACVCILYVNCHQKMYTVSPFYYHSLHDFFDTFFPSETVVKRMTFFSHSIFSREIAVLTLHNTERDFPKGSVFKIKRRTWSCLLSSNVENGKSLPKRA